MSSIFDWSTTAGNNATADANINWSEGQFPSTVNDSARQMMGRQAEWLKDNGVLTAAGTANAITVATNSQVTTPPHGMTIAFRSLAANTGAVTLSINGGSGLPLRKPKIGSANVVDLEANDITQGGAFIVHYDSSANAGVGAWILVNPTASQAAVGAAIASATEKTTPNDGDLFGGILSGGSVLFRTSWLNIKAALSQIFQAELGFTPVRQGFSGSLIDIGWTTDGYINLRVDSTVFGNTWPMNISGNANTVGGSTLATINGNIGGRLSRDNATFAGFAGGDALSPYIRHEATAEVVLLARRDKIGDYISGMSAGGLGTYAMLYYGGTGSLSPGATVAGSSFSWSSAWGNSNIGAPGGSWRCMGYCDTGTQSARVTLHMRYA